MSGPPRLTLLRRAYCHVCDDMLAALQKLRGEHAFDVDLVDIDADPGLAQKYNELVPVLLGGEAEICHYFLDEPKLREYLGRFR